MNLSGIFRSKNSQKISLYNRAFTEKEEYRNFFLTLQPNDLLSIFCIHKPQLIEYILQMRKQARDQYCYYFYTTTDFSNETPVSKAVGHFAVKLLNSSTSGELNIEHTKYWDEFFVDRFLFFRTDLSQESEPIKRDSSNKKNNGKKKPQKKKNIEKLASITKADASVFSEKFTGGVDTIILMTKLLENPKFLLDLMMKVTRGNFLSSFQSVTLNEKKDYVCRLSWFDKLGYHSLATYVASRFEESFWIYFYKKRNGAFNSEAIHRMKQIKSISKIWEDSSFTSRYECLPLLGTVANNLYYKMSHVLAIQNPFATKSPLGNGFLNKTKTDSLRAVLSNSAIATLDIWYSGPSQRLIHLIELLNYDEYYLENYRRKYNSPYDEQCPNKINLEKLFFLTINGALGRPGKFYLCIGSLIRQNITLRQATDIIQREIIQGILKDEARLVAIEKKEFTRIEKELGRIEREKKKRVEALERKKKKREIEREAKWKKRQLAAKNLAIKEKRTIQKGIHSIILEILSNAQYQIAEKEQKKKQELEMIKKQELKITNLPLSIEHICYELCSEHFFQNLKNEKYCKTLTDDITLFMNQLNDYISNHVYPIRESIISSFKAEIRTILPHSKIAIYGSYGYGIYDERSDVDIVILDAPKTINNEDTFDALNTLFSAKKWVRRCKAIKSAKVPVIKIEHAFCDVELDITLQYSLQGDTTPHRGIETAKLITNFAEEYPDLVPMGIILKQFMRERKLHLPFHGGINSYGLLLMIVAYLQIYGMHALNIGQLLLGFFKLYGLYFPFECMGIDAKEGKFFIIEAAERSKKLSPSHFLPPATVIIDPCEPYYNVSYSAFGIYDIKKAFKETYHRITSSSEIRSSNLLLYITKEANS